MFRKMEVGDLPSVVQIERLVQTHPWNERQFLDSINSHICFIAEQNQHVVGFCILQPVLDEANLLLMAIHPKMQGQGLGFALLQAAMNELPNNPVQIFLEVRESNIAAIKLYEKAGFHQIDLRKHYYPQTNGGREHAVIMVKSCSDDFAALFK